MARATVSGYPMGLLPTMTAYRWNCRKKNIFFGLTPEQFHKITQKDCIYCGSPPGNQYRGYRYNGIDRKDNSKGYFPSNCVPCCARCNSVKSNHLTFSQMKRAMKAALEGK